MAEDPYVYPGTFTLINLRDIRDIDRLHDFEANSTFRRGLELLDRPVVGTFNRVRLQRIHKHLFQDVYGWAGKIRTVDIRKEDSTYFARPEFITTSLDEIFFKLDRKGGLVGVDAVTFADRAGDLLGDLNAIHPFREGNGRAQQEFVRELASRAGHELSWARVSREDMYRESAASFNTGNSTGLAKLLATAIIAPGGDKERADFVRSALEKMRAQSTTILKSAIAEKRVSLTSVVSGKVFLVSARHIAIATGPRSFSVLDRSKLSRDVAEGENIKARIGAHVIAITDREKSQFKGRSR